MFNLIGLCLLSESAQKLLKLVDWSKVSERVVSVYVGDGFRSAARIVTGRLHPDALQKAAAVALALFTDEFVKELEDHGVASIEMPNFQAQVASILEAATPELAEFVSPETQAIDLGPIRRMIEYGLSNSEIRLPASFNWNLVSTNLARAIRVHLRKDPALAAALTAALAEESKAALARMAPLDPGFQLPEYRDFLRRKCGFLGLSALHTSAYDRRILLWSVFVQPNARVAHPLRIPPRESHGQHQDELPEKTNRTTSKHVSSQSRLLDSYISTQVAPAVKSLESEENRCAVILGDPGSGKTSLLRYLILRWVELEQGQFPVLVDLKEYAREDNRKGFLKFTESAPGANFNLRATDIEKLFASASACLYLDGLDEIFEPSVRLSILNEIVAFSSRYASAQVVVTTRIVGYDSDLLSNAGFTHLTLEDFGDAQVSEFLGRWYEASQPDSEKERDRLKSQLERARADSRAIRELSGNPLLLTMMAILNGNQDLPRDRVELYREASRVLLHEWDVRKALPSDTFGRQEKEELLRELSGQMQLRSDGLASNLIDRASLMTIFRDYLKRIGVPDPHSKAQELIWLLTERNFILCYAGGDCYSYVHRTFLEYYCASWYVDRLQKKGSLTRSQLQGQVFGLHWRDEAWHEVLRLIVGMVDESLAGELIRFLMGDELSHKRLASLTLAAACLGEVRNRHALKQVDDDLFSHLTMELFEPLAVVNTTLAIERSRSPEEAMPTQKYLARAAQIRSAMKVLASTWPTPRAREWLTTILENFEGNERLQVLRLAAAEELAERWRDDPDTRELLINRSLEDTSKPIRSAIQRRLGLN